MKKAMALTVLTLALAAGCGSSRPAKTTVYSAHASLASLRHGGWTGAAAAGMPDTLTKARQVGYLGLTAPDGQRLDAQFFEDSAKATAELASARKQLVGFRGATLANAMVFTHPDGKRDLSSDDLAALEKLLR
jgi:hypothetical protein